MHAKEILDETQFELASSRTDLHLAILFGHVTWRVKNSVAGKSYSRANHATAFGDPITDFKPNILYSYSLPTFF